MDTIERETTLGELVIGQPALMTVLERLGLDYCCGGGRRLDEACRAAGLDVDETIAALEVEPPSDIDTAWATLGMADLAAHIESSHHSYLHDELPRLSALADKVATVHGARHPELATVRATYETLRADLEPHLMKEEQVLFPMIRELAAADAALSFHCGSVSNPISMMSIEHDRAGELLATLRTLTDGYTVPGDGCASYQALYDGLARLEADTHLHVHKENNVLFPMAVAAERGLTV